MQLLLSKLVSETSIQIILTEPELDISEKLVEGLKSVMLANLLIEHSEEKINIIEYGNFVNYIFTIQSRWHPNKFENLMLTGMMEQHENPKIFHKIFKETIRKFRTGFNLYKGAYLDSNKDDEDIPAKNSQMKDLLQNLNEGLTLHLKTHKLALGNLIFLGIQAVGKTTIIHRLIEGDYREHRRCAHSV